MIEMTPETVDVTLPVREASAEAAVHGLGWNRRPVTLTPMPKLVGLIRESRRLSSASVGEDAGGS